MLLNRFYSVEPVKEGEMGTACGTHVLQEMHTKVCSKRLNVEGNSKS